MTHEQIIRINMFQVVCDYLTNNVELVGNLPNYSEWFTSFSDAIAALFKMMAAQAEDSTGVSVRKNELKQALGNATFNLASRIHSYAMQNHLPQLKANSYYPISRFRFGTDTYVRNHARKLHDLAQQHLEPLIPYGVTPEALETLSIEIETYNEALIQKRSKVTAQTSVTRHVETLFMEANEALSQLDALVDIIRLAEPSFFRGYQAARRLVDTRNDSLAMQGQVLEDATEQPVPNVTIELMRLPLNGHAPVTKQSARLGGFRVKSLEPGMYRVTASKLGYTEQTMEVAVNSGETTDVRIAIQKV